MAVEWPVRTIAECAALEPYSTQIGPFGEALMADEYTPSGVPVLRGVNVNFGRFHDDDFVFINEETADRLSKFESFPGDVLLVHKGTLGQIGLMPKERCYRRYIMGNSMMRVRCNPTKLLPEYLYYWLSSADGQHYLFSRVSQVGVPQLQTPLTTLRQARLPVPPLSEQSAIVRVLGALDDKIELNQRMSQILEAMARALFKSWFVDFDPVRARTRSLDPWLRAGTVEMFPDSFEDSELGEIPSGWTVRPFTETVDVVGGGTPSTSRSNYWGGDIPWFSLVDAPAPSDVWAVATEKSITPDGLRDSATRLLSVGTTIISARGTVGRVALVGVPMAMNQSCYGLQSRLSPRGYFSYFSTRHVVGDLAQLAHGSVFDTITRETLASVIAVVPPSPLVEAFDKAVAPMMERVRVGRFEFRNLAQMRDALLGELVAGRSRPPDLAIGCLRP